MQDKGSDGGKNGSDGGDYGEIHRLYGGIVPAAAITHAA